MKKIKKQKRVSETEEEKIGVFFLFRGREKIELQS